MKRLLSLSLALFFSFASLFANNITGILCPQDFDLWCSDDEEDTNTTGVAFGTGIYASYTTHYTDIDDVTACNEGNIYRTWFVDINSNNALDVDEPNCLQVIFMEFVDAPFNLTFPPNITISCDDEENFGEPSWTTGPCDLVASSMNTEQSTAIGSGCYSILNEYTVINWCQYHPNDPNWNGEGIWKHIQTVKVIDNDAPEFNSCENLIFTTDSNCQAELEISASAEDLGPCASDELFWTLSVDLWGDNTEDYFYGPNESGQFQTNGTANNEDIRVIIPELVGISSHKISWKVYDYCGNVRACNQEINVVDQKAPTPYCYRTISSNYWAGDDAFDIHVNQFDKGAFDNCSDNLLLSFSTDVTDTLRSIDCDLVGPNEMQVYVTDEYGNQDYCTVNLFIADNGSCDFSFDLEGRVVGVDEQAIEGATLSLMNDDGDVSNAISNESGEFVLEEIGAFSDYFVQPSFEVDPMDGVSTLDLVLIQKHILDLYEFDSPYQYLAADINNDKNLSALDLLELRKVILGIYTDFPNNEKFFFVDPNTEMPNDAVPTEVNSTNYLTEYDGMMEFVGVKLADVNNSFIHQFDGQTSENRSDESMDLVVLDELINGEYLAHIYAKEATELLGFQMRFKTNDQSLELISGQLELQEGFNFTIVDNNLTLLDHRGMSWNTEEPLFSIKSNTLLDLRLSPNEFRSELYQDIQSTPLEIRLEDSNGSYNDQLNVYPNPTRDQLTIQSGTKLISKLELYNTQGKRIKFTYSQNTKDSKVLNLNGLSEGIYFVHITSESTKEVKKIYLLR